MKLLLKNCFYVFLLLFILHSFSGNSQTLLDTTALSEVILKGSPIRATVQQSASAISVITTAQINQNDGVILTSVLNKVPGVFMQQGNLNTNRITIRGIGARSQFSTNRIKAYYENIPLSNGEGDTVLEDIDLESLSTIEITKGPNSTSFGAGLGGVIHLMAKSTPENTSFGKAATTFGSFGQLKTNLSAGFSTEKSNIYLVYANLSVDGFRENSQFNRQSINLTGKHQLTEKSSLSFFGIATRLKAFIPSSLNQTDFENNPEVAANNWKAAQGYESYDKVQLGLGYKNQFSEQWSIESSVFSTLIDAYEPRPFNILDDQSETFGFRFQLNYNQTLFSFPTKICLGTEVLYEDYSFALFANLYQSQPNQGSISGSLLAENEQRRTYQNYFLQLETKLYTKLFLESGIALNHTVYKQTNEVANQTAFSNNYAFGSIFSPRIGISYEVTPNKNIYTSVSKGFSIPSVAESLTPNGLINTDLQPEIGINYEVGFKGNFWRKKLYTELNFYTTEVSNLLVARRVAEDQFIGINAGKSLHRGMEWLFQLKLIEQKAVQLQTFFSGTYTEIRFKEFLELDSDYSGNLLPAVPRTQWNFGVDLQTKIGLTTSISYGKVGQMALNDANTLFTNSYDLLDAKVIYTFKILEPLTFQCQTGVQNMLNEAFAASVLPNAVGFGSNAPRYFYPGNPINFYGGFSLVYQL